MAEQTPYNMTEARTALLKRGFTVDGKGQYIHATNTHPRTGQTIEYRLEKNCITLRQGKGYAHNVDYGAVLSFWPVLAPASIDARRAKRNPEAEGIDDLRPDALRRIDHDIERTIRGIREKGTYIVRHTQSVMDRVERTGPAAYINGLGELQGAPQTFDAECVRLSTLQELREELVESIIVTRAGDRGDRLTVEEFEREKRRLLPPSQRQAQTLPQGVVCTYRGEDGQCNKPAIAWLDESAYTAYCEEHVPELDAVQDDT